MKLVIVAKTRMQGGACVGAITFDGQSVRLVDPKQDTDHRFNLEYEIGEVWEVEGERPESVRPPHVENIVVRQKRRLCMFEALDGKASFNDLRLLRIYYLSLQGLDRKAAL